MQLSDKRVIPRSAGPKGLLLLALFFIAGMAQAQYTSRLGRFQVDQKKGCAPFTVTITNTNLVTTGECTPGKPCLMDFEGKNQQQQNAFTFTYTTPGTYKLSVLYQSIGSDDIMITVDQNIQPAFDIFTCSNSKVSIDITDKSYDQYVVDFNNDGTPETILPSSNNQTASFSYGTPGTYVLNVRGRDSNAADNCAAKVQNFNALAVLPPTTLNTVTAVDASSIKLDFITQPNIQYKLEIATNNSSTFQLYQNVYAISTVTATSLKPDDNYYCFRLGSYDPCAGSNVYSNTICSHNFDLTLLNGSNKLDWNTSTAGITSVEIRRDKNSYTVIPGSPVTFTDVDVTCGTTYCYQVVSNYAGGGKSISLEKCGMTFKTATATAVNNISSVVNTAGTSVDLSWIQDPAFTVSQYNIFKSSARFPLSQVAVATTPAYTDPLYTTDGINCYRVDYEDVCKNKSATGSIICPLRLSGSLDSKNAVTLNWNSYKGWNGGVKNYTIEKYNVQNALIKTFTTTDTTFVDDQADPANQQVSYIVKANANASGLITSVSNLDKFTKQPNLYAPTAFTPNGDGLNDTFTVSGQFIVKMELNIFDRWGVLVFSSSNKNEPWNGTREGKPLTEGAYVWKVNVTDLSGKTFSNSGTVGLLQKAR